MTKIDRELRPTLVVGSGLTGAALAFIAARSGVPTILVSLDRPAGRSTCLASPIVHGIGPPFDPESWSRMPGSAMSVAVARARHGYELLKEVLLAASRPCGFRRLPHVLIAPADAAPGWAEHVARTIDATAWPCELAQRDGEPALRRTDALVDLRRVTFELLRRGASNGLAIRLGEPFGGIEDLTDDGVKVRFGRTTVEFGRVFWAAGGRPIPGAPASLPPVPGRTRLVLHQVLATARTPLDEVLENGDRRVLFTPHPSRPERSILVRIARLDENGRVDWPELPRSWNALRGAAQRDRLAEVSVAGPGQPFLALQRLVVMSGMSSWPVSARLGACLEAWSTLAS